MLGGIRYIHPCCSRLMIAFRSARCGRRYNRQPDAPMVQEVDHFDAVSTRVEIAPTLGAERGPAFGSVPCEKR